MKTHRYSLFMIAIIIFLISLSNMIYAESNPESITAYKDYSCMDNKSVDFEPLEYVYLGGTKFASNITINILGEGLGASCDPGYTIVNITRTIISNGSFCIPVYRVRWGDVGNYKIKIDEKTAPFSVKQNIYSDSTSTCCSGGLGDNDYDGVCDDFDNCIGLDNPLQYDTDGDGIGNDCDSDDDNDGVNDTDDNCPQVNNSNQYDGNNNSIGDACDGPYNEICDNNDNDADTEIDEDIPYLAYGSIDIGLCEYGLKECIFGEWFIKTNATEPTDEICNSLDDDCDGVDDNGVLNTYYQDFDDDFFGNLINITQQCIMPEGYVTDSTDCDDNNTAVNPNATEILNNGIDDDCNPATLDNSSDVCGNNYIESGEQCDDNNTLDGDGCSNTCQFEYCQIGEYSSNVLFNLTGLMPCEECEMGYYQNETGQASCKACNLGTYQNETGQASCKACAGGTFADQTNSTSCTPCEAYESSEEGATSCYTSLWATLSLTKTAKDMTDGKLTINDSVRYTLIVNNTGNNTAYNVVVTDDLPDEVTCVNVSGYNAPVCNDTNDTIIWSISTLNVSQSATLYIDVAITNATENTSIINVGHVSASNLDTNASNTTTPQVCADASTPVNGTCTQKLCTVSNEICDNIDNDCDGIIDKITQLSGGLGICSVNTKTCIDGNWTSNNEVAPVTELCTNSIDDDCDGTVNEGCTSGGGTGGGSGGGSTCKENWTCSEWSECSIDLTQSRVCVDEANCTTEKKKPALTQNCTEEVFNQTSDLTRSKAGSDSLASGLVTCGDGVCQDNEDAVACPEDCAENPIVSSEEEGNSTAAPKGEGVKGITGGVISAVAKTRWWIALLVLALVAGLGYGYYYFVHSGPKEKNPPMRIY